MGSVEGDLFRLSGSLSERATARRRAFGVVWSSLCSMLLSVPVLAQQPGHTTLKTVIPVPGVAGTTRLYYDGSYVDQGRRLYHLGDRTTKGIDFVDIATNGVISQIIVAFPDSR